MLWNEILHELAINSNGLWQIEKAPFSIEEKLSSDEFQVVVDGVGQLTFPLDQSEIEKLLNATYKSSDVMLDQLLLQKDNRTYYEIREDKVEVDVQTQSMNRILTKISHAMGLPPDSMLTAHLDRMLIFVPGHFFKRDQDPDRLKNMVATLRIVLPSAHTGGNLVVHHDQKRVFITENVNEPDAKCIGFYTDYMHEVEVVRDGCRVELIYNLVLESQTIDANQKVNQNLKHMIKTYVEKSLEVQKEISSFQSKIVVFLDHSYTESSLKWENMKGTDRCTATSLLVIAKLLDLLPHLALVEVMEHWSCSDEDDKILLNLKRSESKLYGWVDADNKKMPFEEEKMNDDDIYEMTEYEEYKAYKSKYTPSQLVENGEYMDLKGCRKDLWFKRAAIVLWPRANEVKMKFQQCRKHTLEDLWELSKNPENILKVWETIENGGYYLWEKCSENEKEDLDLFVKIAVNLKDGEKAKVLLGKFKWPVLRNDIAVSLVSLQCQYGSEWCVELLQGWAKKCHKWDLLMDEVHLVIQKLMDNGADKELASVVLTQDCKNIVTESSRGKETGLELGNSRVWRLKALRDFFRACAIIKDTQNLQRVIDYIMDNKEFYPTVHLAEIFFEMSSVIKDDYFAKFNKLKNYLRRALNHELRLKENEVEDWSLSEYVPCDCEHCEVLVAFLESKTAKKKVWSVNEEIRKHLMYQANTYELPINYYEHNERQRLKFVKMSFFPVDNQKRFKKMQVLYKKLKKFPF